MLLLDLYCGAGGAARGYQKAGFTVVGVDIHPQPHYCGDHFIQTGAVGFMEQLLARESDWSLDGFTAIHASPPCQRWTRYTIPNREAHPNMIPITRALLERSGLPWIIENVEMAPLKLSAMLCGSMFDPVMDIQRHRLFETSLDHKLFKHPNICRHHLHVNTYPDRGGRVRRTVEVGNSRIPLTIQKEVMGVDWDISMKELSECVPVRYTEFLGNRLKEQIL